MGLIPGDGKQLTGITERTRRSQHFHPKGLKERVRRLNFSAHGTANSRPATSISLLTTFHPLPNPRAFPKRIFASIAAKICPPEAAAASPLCPSGKGHSFQVPRTPPAASGAGLGGRTAPLSNRLLPPTQNVEEPNWGLTFRCSRAPHAMMTIIVFRTYLLLNPPPCAEAGPLDLLSLLPFFEMRTAIVGRQCSSFFTSCL